ncbi:phosphatase PAP2 family protein [Candidatus Pacearchaeota archaeon]|nr:phosphatase PAP2 family protein [Candidatus Pacearchaeota archaeon]
MTLNTATNQFFQTIQTPTLTSFSKLIAVITEPLVLLTLALIISTILYFTRQKSQAFLLASMSILTALTIKILKNILQIPRPLNALIQETGYSFPSGHTTFATLFFILTTYLLTRNSKLQTKITAFTISIIIILTIALTRLYLRVHWLTDVIGGLFIGGIILIASIIIYKTNIKA